MEQQVLSWTFLLGLAILPNTELKPKRFAATINLYVVVVENEEPLSARLARITPSEELEDMISRAEANPNAIVWGTFHRWDFDTA